MNSIMKKLFINSIKKNKLTILGTFYVTTVITLQYINFKFLKSENINKPKLICH